jgi:hypothetical protein
LQVLLPVYFCAGIPTATLMAEDITPLVLAIFTMRPQPKDSGGGNYYQNSGGNWSQSGGNSKKQIGSP